MTPELEAFVRDWNALLDDRERQLAEERQCSTCITQAMDALLAEIAPPEVDRGK